MTHSTEQLLSFGNKHCRIVCRPEYLFLKSSLLNFSNWFDENGEAIHADRNILKRFRSSLIEGLQVDLVAKSFKVQNPLSAFIYTHLRESKARRSFENSLKLLNAGFSVPEPVAYIECFGKGILKESFYISEAIDFDCTLHEVYREQMFDWRTVVPLVIEQAYLMHASGFMHRDFSPGNILIKEVDGQYQFSFVDLNRLYIGAVSFDEGLKSFVRLANNDELLLLLTKVYSSCAHKDDREAYDILSVYLAKHRLYKERKVKIKKILGLDKKK
jgi:tRNA A-37 threonylcarbamoyl transferase component Bud32